MQSRWVIPTGLGEALWESGRPKGTTVNVLEVIRQFLRASYYTQSQLHSWISGAFVSSKRAESTTLKQRYTGQKLQLWSDPVTTSSKLIPNYVDREDPKIHFFYTFFHFVETR